MQLFDNHLMLAKFDLMLLSSYRAVRNYLDFDSIRIEPVIYSTGVDAAYGYELKLKLGLAGNEVFC